MKLVKKTVEVNKQFWRIEFVKAWDTLAWDAKLAWTMLFSQLIGLITLIELLVLKTS